MCTRKNKCKYWNESCENLSKMAVCSCWQTGFHYGTSIRLLMELAQVNYRTAEKEIAEVFDSIAVYRSWEVPNG